MRISTRVISYTFQIEFVFLSLKLVVKENNVNPDEMPHYEAFHLGFHCKSKYVFRSRYSTQRVND